MIADDHPGADSPDHRITTGDAESTMHAFTERVGQELDAPGEALLRALVLLDHPVAVTGNPAAIITQAGGYLHASRRGQAFALEQGHIGLRTDAQAVTSGVLTRDESHHGVISTLHLLDACGRPVHRCRTMTDADQLTLERLDDREGGVSVAEAVLTRLPRDPRPAEPSDPADQLAQLDALLTDCGILRRQGLTTHPLGVQAIDAEVLPMVVEHLCAVGLPFSSGVVGAHAFHAATGPILSTTMAEGGMLLRYTDATVDYDLTMVSECLLVEVHGPHGVTSAIELYDHQQHCIGVLGQFGLVGHEVHEAWEDLTSSLPAA